MLVVGGGDGGTVTQLLHFARVEQIVWVEIDALVVETAASFFPKLKRVIFNLSHSSAHWC